MSTRPFACSTCGRDCIYDRCAPFGKGQEDVYAVAWRCPDGHGLSLDVCPVGPLVPAPGLCLNCGAAYTSDAADSPCGVCGLSRQACPTSLGLAATVGDDPVSAAREAFAQGLYRRGLAVLNQALQENPELVAPWFIKGRFLHSVGFNRAAARMFDGALASCTRAADRIAMLEEQSFLWAECLRGEEALNCANAAAELGSNSVRTRFLRGRALALLGRLDDARREMTLVLSLDPNNADAQRGLTMIDAALRPNAGKRWWQFWRR